ncbi:MAG TPA: hypothetical protein VFW13_02835, partial [Phenylobacterium sp.]|nr:hypothetical protein [Phenylobacterium sp.]
RFDKNQIAADSTSNLMLKLSSEGKGEMPIRPRANHGGPWRPPAGWSPGAGDVVALGAAFNLTYSSIAIYALANPDGPLGVVVGKWIEVGRDAPIYALAGRAGCGGAKVSSFVARAWIFDVHLVVINLIVVAGLIAASRRYWATWSRELYGALHELGLGGDAIDQGADIGYVTVLCGAVGALWWMVLHNDLFDSAAHCAALQPWHLLRIPLLATITHGFICVAAAFWVAREP